MSQTTNKLENKKNKWFKDWIKHKKENLVTKKYYNGVFTLTPEKELIIRVSAIINEYLQNLRSNKILIELRKSAERGIYPLKAPVGYYDRLQPNGEYKLEVSCDSIFISKAFELFADGKSIEEVLEEININDLTPNILTNILQNPVYAGYYEFDGVIYRGNHLPLISQELFDKVQNRFMEEKKGN